MEAKKKGRKLRKTLGSSAQISRAREGLGISREPQRSALEGKLRHPQKGDPLFQCLIPKPRQSEDMEHQGIPGDPLEQGWRDRDPNLSTGFKKGVPEKLIWSRNVRASSFNDYGIIREVESRSVEGKGLSRKGYLYHGTGWAFLSLWRRSHKQGTSGGWSPGGQGSGAKGVLVLKPRHS